MTFSTRYSRLEHLFGAYFHQDWNTEGDDWPDLVRNYLRIAHSDETRETVAEIDQLLAEGNPEEQLAERLLRQFGCYYAPHQGADGPGLREWLVKLANMLRSNVA